MSVVSPYSEQIDDQGGQIHYLGEWSHLTKQDAANSTLSATYSANSSVSFYFNADCEPICNFSDPLSHTAVGVYYRLDVIGAVFPPKQGVSMSQPVSEYFMDETVEGFYVTPDNYTEQATQITFSSSPPLQNGPHVFSIALLQGSTALPYLLDYILMYYRNGTTTIQSASSSVSATSSSSSLSSSETSLSTTISSSAAASSPASTSPAAATSPAAILVESPSTPVGAIVGGAVGGMAALLAAILTAIFLFLWYRRNRGLNYASVGPIHDRLDPAYEVTPYLSPPYQSYSPATSEHAGPPESPSVVLRLVSAKGAPPAAQFMARHSSRSRSGALTTPLLNNTHTESSGITDDRPSSAEVTGIHPVSPAIMHYADAGTRFGLGDLPSLVSPGLPPNEFRPDYD
ncbi:hypothetical protein AcW2_007759 [Taiwanofungus camphoratus]|nr:hypothetical protein AcW2_007759 [Antrodia cinnamomea]